MPNLFMDFLQKVENFGKGAVQSVVNPAAKLGNEVGALGDLFTGNQQAAQNLLNPGGGLLHQGGVEQGAELHPTAQNFGKSLEQIGGTGAELASNAIAPEAGAAVAGGKDLGMDFIKGAVAGGTAGATGTAGSELANGQGLNFGQIAQGAAVGGVLGGAGAAVHTAIQPVHAAGLPSDQFTDDQLQKMAKSDNPKTIQKQLEPVTGPVVAQKIAPAIAQTDDPAIIKNQVDNALNQHLAPATPDVTGTAQPLPFPEPIPPPTPTGDINTPAQVEGQASSEVAAYNPQQEPTINDLLNQFSTLRKQAGSDEDFYNNTILNNQETPGKIGQLSRSIARGVEGYGANISDELDDQLSPLTPDELAGNVQPDKDAQLNDLKQTARQLEKDTGQKGLYSNLAQNMANMTQDEQIAYLSEGLKNARDSGAQAAVHIGVQPSDSPQSDEESLAQQGQQLPPSAIKELPPDFINAPGTEPTQGSHISTLAANTGMHDILNSGGTTDEALMHYMNATGSNYGEAQDALNKLIQDSGSGGSLDRSKINASLNPQYDTVDLPEATSRDAAVLNAKLANNGVVRAGNDAVQAMQGLDEHDLDLVRELRGNNPGDVLNQAHDKAQFEQVIDTLKDYNDYTQAAGAKLGQDIPYRQNYGLRTPYLPPEEAGAGTTPSATLPTNAAYTKSRVYNTHAEALANGETPRYANALEDLQADVQNRAHDQSQLALAKGLEQAYPGQVEIINNGQIPSGYQQLLIPNGEKIFMPKEIASDINTREMASPAKGWLGGYDKGNAIGKNLELGGGFFHALNTAGIYVGQQLMSGDLFKHPASVGRVVANMFSDKATTSYLTQLGKEGTFDNAHSVLNAADASGLLYHDASADIGSPKDEGIVGKVASIPGLKQIHESIFERQIPTMKLETFRQQTQGLDIFGNAADREQAIKIAKSINQSYGDLNRDIQGLTPKQFQRAGRLLLATGYQEGQIRTLLDAVSKGGVEGKLARQAVFGKALLFGGLTTLGAAVGGNFQGQSPKEVALAIMNKAINPSFDIAGYKVGLPATQISNIAKPVEQTISAVKEGKTALTGAENFASSHAAFVPSKVEEVASNKNFEGNAIYGKDYFGRPISPGTTAENLASGILPIPLAETAQTATGNQSTGAAIANTVGLNASPEYNLNYAPIAGQTYVQQLEKTPGVTKSQVQADTQFFDLLGEGVKRKNTIITKAEAAIKAGNTQQANKVINEYNQKLAKTLLPWEQSGGTKYLDTTMLQLLRTAQITYAKTNKNVAYVTKTNPTSIGVPIEALSSVPQPTNQGA